MLYWGGGKRSLTAYEINREEDSILLTLYHLRQTGRFFQVSIGTESLITLS